MWGRHGGHNGIVESFWQEDRLTGKRAANRFCFRGWLDGRTEISVRKVRTPLGQRCRVTPGRGNSRESATENRPPNRVRVKRWGKGPPRFRQRKWHGKPHREQCRIGFVRGATAFLVRKVTNRVGSNIAAAMRRADEWPSKGSNPLDRIRLTGHPRTAKVKGFDLALTSCKRL